MEHATVGLTFNLLTDTFFVGHLRMCSFKKIVPLQLYYYFNIILKWENLIFLGNVTL